MNSSHDLKSAGLKATLPRIKIINLFETSKVRHLTAEEVPKAWSPSALCAMCQSTGRIPASWVSGRNK